MILKWPMYAEEEVIRGFGRWNIVDGIEEITTFPVFLRSVVAQQGDKGESGEPAVKCFLDEEGKQITDGEGNPVGMPGRRVIFERRAIQAEPPLSPQRAISPRITINWLRTPV